MVFLPIYVVGNQDVFHWTFTSIGTHYGHTEVHRTVAFQDLGTVPPCLFFIMFKQINHYFIALCNRLKVGDGTKIIRRINHYSMPVNSLSNELLPLDALSTKPSMLFQ